MLPTPEEEAAISERVDQAYDRRRPIVEQMLSRIETTALGMTERVDLNDPRPPPLIFAAGDLLRCTRLLRGQFALLDAGLFEVASLPLRPALEAWWVATYITLTGDTGLDRVRGAHVRELNRLKGDDIEASTALVREMWDGPIDSITWR